ncbi:hypothetical protein RBB68_06695 [Leptospira interrogans]|uniref:Uncharacterized protein n=13 Tax=Leptospira interrogans TaxID=173 RepID=A0A1X8WM79_LEPIR|nr:hypothetical protein [Leptospira interrogans]EMG23592.1 hypothetical protein LEP1GSC150_3329 [Leptospira interrogans serovar Copenhageni str. LT2050]EMM79151.1 hypothetical protein LEP1GSC037_4072 [Leptospira interrogans str. 2006001854]EMY06803.1 hypothetical protein LEP1GSC029_4240 [Leptospira interrogans str. 2002000626]KAA1267545.1 hypothetical protein C5473_05390 [Leptospira interrogans serovar Weerasinghe]KAA1291875.1 hypothetical protein C4X99_17430 [Leptospira interrogans serovar Ge
MCDFLKRIFGFILAGFLTIQCGKKNSTQSEETYKRVADAYCTQMNRCKEPYLSSLEGKFRKEAALTYPDNVQCYSDFNYDYDKSEPIVLKKLSDNLKLEAELCIKSVKRADCGSIVTYQIPECAEYNTFLETISIPSLTK